MKKLPAKSQPKAQPRVWYNMAAIAYLHSQLVASYLFC